MKQRCQQTLEAVEILRQDGSAYRVLEPATEDRGTPSEIQQWLLIDTVVLGAEGPPEVRFTLERPDVQLRLELAEQRYAIAAARKWADQQEEELHRREIASRRETADETAR